MAAATLLIDAALLLLSAALFALVGRVTSRRHVGGGAQLAATLFSLWWYVIAALNTVTAFTHILGWAGYTDLALHETFTFVAMFLLCLALWALLYYLVYLFSGSRRFLVPISAFYAVYYAALVYLVTYSHPTSVNVQDWTVSLAFERQVVGLPLALASLLFVIPPILGALGYARLYFRVEDATQRYRIGLVSATIATWFGVVLIAWMADVSHATWWQLASRVIGLGAALLVYAAYRPPAWVRARWGIQSVDGARTT